ncbi:MAG TPA: GTP-sensing pleiotropic transcriptional regulator CodY [Bacillota bacterium]|nr:GTP-sensing pleiotropic transcriptional regulator CodY [Bacillota bacterium]
MSTLLQKTRSMNRLIQKSEGQPVAFEEMATVLAALAETNVVIVGRRGAILGSANPGGKADNLLSEKVMDNGHITENFNDYLLNFSRTETLPASEGDYLMSVVPVFGGGERLGTLIFQRPEGEFCDDDFILAEYAATITGIEIMRLKNERLEKETRDKASVQLAMDVLSYSEIEALRHIFNDLQGEEGFVVASKLAQKYKLTRSVIVNALRKLESAGVIDSRSLGMKGTYIKVLNPYLFEHLDLH